MASYYKIPLDNSPNQTFETTLGIDGQNLTLKFSAYYNETAEYWMMDISDRSGTRLLSSIPLIPGDYPANNILGQYKYLKIGSAYVYKVGNVSQDWPGENDWGTNFYLIWSDTPT